MAQQRRRRAERRREAGARQEGLPIPQQPGHARYPEDPELAPLPLSEHAPSHEPQIYPAPPAQDSWPQPPVFAPPAARGGPWAQDLPQPRRDGQARYALLFILSLVLICLIGVFALLAYQPYAAFARKRALLEGGSFFQGVSIDGLPLGGLSPAQAQQRLLQGAAQADEGLRFEILVDGTGYVLTGDQIPFERNSRAQLAAAWALGRQGFVWGIGSDKTPFDIRYEHTRQVAATQPQLSTSRSYDDQALRQAAQGIAAQVDREPIIAVVASFDFGSRSFSFTQDVPGRKLDSNALYEQLKAALDRGQRQATIRMDSQRLLPRVTSVELQNSFTRLSRFTTRTTADSKRNTNIQLAARQIHGQTVMPGQSFSFNQATGERTAQKGYQMAPAIAGGTTVDEIGGGVCQVSSTLFNAAALAGLRIQIRAPHAWPSNYVDMGLDATVNWPNLDFVFANDGQTPVFIVADVAGQDLSIEIYGMKSDPTQSIRLETELISQTAPPAEPIYRQNPALLPGSQQELKKARTGYRVDTYRVWLQNGQPFRREKLFSSNYPMVQQVIEYN